MENKEFYEKKAVVDAFKGVVKSFVQEHKMALTSQCEYLTPQDDCDGVGTSVLYVSIGGEVWRGEDLNEIISECFGCNIKEMLY